MTPKSSCCATVRPVDGTEAVASEGDQNQRAVSRQRQRLTGLGRRAWRACRAIERGVGDAGETRRTRPPSAVATPCPRSHRRSGSPVARSGVAATCSSIVRVDPVPREVADGDGRHAAGGRRGEGEGWDVARHQGRVVSRASRRASVCARASRVRWKSQARPIEAAASTWRLSICTTPVSGSPWSERERSCHRPVEQPAGRAGPDDDLDVGPDRGERVDDLDLTRGMTEAVPRDVEDRRCQVVACECPESEIRPRPERSCSSSA